MIVAAGAADRQAQHRVAGRADHVVELAVAGEFEFLFGDLGGEHAGGEEAGGRHRLPVIGSQFISGDLPVHELIERHVLVERADDEVAILIGGGTVGIVLESIGLGKARDVQPVARPALAIGGAGEQGVDQLFLGIGGWVIDERIDCLGCGRQAGQIEVGTANQDVACWPDRWEPGSLLPASPGQTDRLPYGPTPRSSPAAEVSAQRLK